MCWISMAARTAFAAWSSSALGRLKVARMASPWYWLMTPPWRTIGSVTAAKYSFRVEISSTGVIASLMVVNPWRSLKKIVVSRTSPGARLDALLRRLDLRRHLARHEAREPVRRRGALDHRADQEVARAGDGDGEDPGHDQHRDHLVELRPEQDAVRGHVLDIVAGDHRIVGRHARGVEHHQQPSERRHRAGEQHVPRLEPQRPQRDEDEDVEQGGHLEIERRGLPVLDVDAPDEREQQHHVDDDRDVEQPVRQLRAGGRGPRASG